MGTSKLQFRDPYLEWSNATDFAGHAAVRGNPEALIPCLLDVEGVDIEQLMGEGWVHVPGVYLNGKVRYCTGWVPRNRIAELQKRVTGLEFSLPIDGGLRRPTPLQPGRNVVGVIDHGCAFLNAAFRCAWKGKGEGDEHLRTRIAAVWDQGQRAHGPWRVPPGFGYGGEVDASVINGLIGKVEAGATEEALYRECGYLVGDDGCLPEFAHGTHVLDIAGGLSLPEAMASSAKPSVPDRADSADLIFVDVPQASLEDTTGAANGAFMLDAVRYILDRAGDGANVVINISLGAFAGPHDGSSLFERALDDVIRECSKRLKLKVTIAGGNSANEKWHAAGKLAGAGSADASKTTATLDWRLLPGDTTDSYVELWFTPQPEEVLVHVTSPDRNAGEVTVGKADGVDPEIGEAMAFGDPPASPKAMLMSFKGRAERSGNASAMLAVRADPAPTGFWRIQLINTGALAVSFDAWIQRDEPRSGARVPLQSYFESADGAAEIDGIGALNSIATGKKTSVVGAARLDNDQPSAYSSRGTLKKAGRRKVRDVNVFASADESASAFGLYTTGVLSDTVIRFSGTSAAAPVVARYWLNRNGKVGYPHPSDQQRVPKVPAVVIRPDGTVHPLDEPGVNPAD